jgi:NADH dehydrogenase [ubiquinone] 1 alpha subcomplex assembly factor 6
MYATLRLSQQTADIQLELHLITTLSQPALAAIRFQFWRDALKAIFSTQDTTIPQHPVAVALADMKRHRPIQRYYLSQMIDARVCLAIGFN